MSSNKDNLIYIVGLAHQYPQYSLTQSQSEELVLRLYPEASTSPALRRLLHVNRSTRILSRPTILDYSTWTKEDAAPPTINELSLTFRTLGVDLTVAACVKAMQEAQVTSADITHAVAVTCTDQGSPGYNLFVNQKLQLPCSVQSTLLQGVGCAGGLSALREAANLAASASSRRRPARILVFATELCSLFLRAELQAALDDSENIHIAPTLFSDGSAAMVVCNGLALGGQQKPIYELQEWDSAVIPATEDHLSYYVSKNGMLATITKDVPKATVSAMPSMFDRLCSTPDTSRNPSTYDWAIHPGGAAILQGAQSTMNLDKDHVQASLDVYQNFGNSSSPTVLIVLDKLRHMDRGRDNVIAASFGPGLIIEMFRMKRCRGVEPRQAISSGVLAEACKAWQSLVLDLLGSGKKQALRVHDPDTEKKAYVRNQ